MCLWALAEHRPMANWLTTPAGAPFARAAMLAAASVAAGHAPAGHPRAVDGPACDDQCSVPG